MKIGPFVISRVRKTAAGLDIYPWQALTEDRVSPELRQIVAKVARSEAKNHLQQLTERLQDEERLRDFARSELRRYEAGYFPLDQETMTALLRVLDLLRQQYHQHQQKENV